MKKLTIVKKTILQTAFVAFILLLASCGFDQKPKDSKDIAEEKNKERFDYKNREKDAQFLVDVAAINLKQIQLGQLAQQKGTTSHVKELGKMMEDAHTKSQRDLTALAARKSITIPTSATNDAMEVYKNLNEKSGKDFDKAYADMMVSRHKDAIAVYEKATTDGFDADIKNWAIATLPVLRTNLNHSLECQKLCNTN
jgi:putative membrane protein